MKWSKMDSEFNIPFDPTMGTSYAEGCTLSRWGRLPRFRLDRALLSYGFVRICWFELWSAINGFHGGVLRTLPAPVLWVASIRAMPG